MNLGGYTADRQVLVPVWMAALLGLAWGWFVILDYDGATEYEAEGADEIYALYVDREMRTMDGAAEFSGLMRWYFEVDEREEVIDDLLRTLDEGASLEIIGMDGHRARAVLHWMTGARDEALEALEAGWEDDLHLCWLMRSLLREKPVGEERLEAMLGEVAAGNGRAWEVWALRQALKQEDRAEGTVFDIYDHQNRRLAWRSFVAFLGTYVVVLIGLGCVPVVVRRWRRRSAPPEHRVVWLWGAPLVLTAFFVSEFVGDISAGVLATIFAFVDDWPVGLEFLYDTVWRVTPVVMFALCMFNRPSHLPRVFGMTRPGQWMPTLAVLAVLGVLWAWDWVTYSMTGGAEILPVQPTDFIYSADPTMGELVFEFFSSCVTAPLVEEIIFRGLLFMGLRRAIGPWGALAVSSFLFGLIHWQYDVFGVMSVMLLGAGNAFLVWRTGSLFPAIVVHAVHNFLISVTVLVAYQLPL